MKNLIILITLTVCLCMMIVNPASAAVELELCYWPVEQSEAIDAAIEKFNQIQDEIHVNTTLIPFSQYFSKLSISMPAGASPDVVLVTPIYEIDYAKNGYLLDISDIFDSGLVDISKFPKFVLDMHTVDGKLRSVPKDYDCIAVFYNREMFDQAGIPYPESGWTWEEFIETAKKLTDTSKQIYGAGLPADIQTVLYDFIYQCGGEIFDDSGKCCVNTPESAEALHKIYDAITVDKISPTVNEFAEIGSDVRFQSGTEAMCLNGSWNMNQFEEVLGDQLGVVSLPVMKQFKTISESIGWIIPKSTNHPEEAKKLLVWLGGKEAQDIMADAAISAYQGSSRIWTEKYKDNDAEVFTNSITDESVVTFPVAQKESHQISSILTDSFTEIMATGKIEEGLAKMQGKINTLLE